MATAKSVVGDYTTTAVFTVTESAANTLTFEKLETGMSIYDKVGWVVQRVEFTSIGVQALMNGSGDYVVAALTMSNQMTDISSENPAVILSVAKQRVDFGTAASGMMVNEPSFLDYTTLAGGGILVLPNPLYLGVKGTGLTGASTFQMKVYFQAVTLTDADYFNLVQARQILVSF